MDYLLIGLVALAAFALGLASFSTLAYRSLLKRATQGRPAYLTLPGNRPGHAVTYAVTGRGHRRVTPKGPSKRARRKARRRLEQAMKQRRAAAKTSPAQAMRARLNEITTEPVSEETA